MHQSKYLFQGLPKTKLESGESGGGDDGALDAAVDDALELDHVLDEIPYGRVEQQMSLMLLELQLL